MKAYRSLFRRVRGQALDTVFAHFYAIKIDPSRADYIPADYDRPFRMVAEKTSDGYAAWQFHQPRFQHKHRMSDVPKLRNYLDYTFVRLNELEQTHPGKHFRYSADQERVCFNTGLQNKHGADLLATFVRYKERPGAPERISPDWVFKGCYAPNDLNYRSYFGTDVPEIAWYSTNSRDFIFDLTYQLQRDVFDHLFERAKERAGMPNAHDEIVRTYLRGALENLVPKIKRNYKIAIPVYYVEEKRMQILLPFVSANDLNEVSCFLVDREEETRSYRIKTIFDLDQAYFSARLITRPDREWLDP